MKAPTTVKLAFDPTESGVACFTSETAKIIWCCIRKQHLVDQHFDSQVFGFAESIDEDMPKCYNEFKDRVNRSLLNRFGTKYVGTNFEIRCCTTRRLDDEFWHGVWEYITGKKKLEIITIDGA